MEDAMSRARMRRVDEAIREVVGQGIAGLKDPRVGFVTVTDVKTSPDLSHARVWVSVLERPDGGEEGAHEARARTLAGLEHAHGHLQRRVADELHLKRTPVLSFHYDETAERAMRIRQLMDRADAPGDDGDQR
jgi:ribosome-binding factor A